MTKASELREMSDEQLRLTHKEAAENLFRLRLQAQTERLDAPSELRRQRRTIARVKTIQAQRAVAAAAKETAKTTSAKTVSSSSKTAKDQK
jgi:large subunit ribosomal protein L29